MKAQLLPASTSRSARSPTSIPAYQKQLETWTPNKPLPWYAGVDRFLLQHATG